MKKILLTIALIMGMIGISYAQFVSNFKDASGTVGTSSTLALASNSSRQYLLIQNVSGNNLGVTVDGSAASIGAAGTITLATGQGLMFNINVPAGAVYVIGSSSGTAYTIKYL